MAEGEYPILALPPGEAVPPVQKPSMRGGPGNPTKKRQIERLEPEFQELRRVLDAHRAELSSSALGAGPEHVLVFETNGRPDEFFDAVAQHPELEWLLDYEDWVPEDDDFKKVRRGKRMRPRVPKGTQTIKRFVYMVMFNQAALRQLLSSWETYKATSRMPTGLGHWSAIFRCLVSIRRWGARDRLREADLLRDALEPIDPQRVVPVEVELWPRSAPHRTRTEARLRTAVEASGGTVLDTAVIPEIHYHAMLVELPHGQLEALLDGDVEWLQIDDIYLIRATPQCATSIDAASIVEGPRAVPTGPATGKPVVALLDGLPVENHPHLRGCLVVDDPDDWGASYQVSERKHGTAMASLIVRGGQDLTEPPLPEPVYVRPILKPERDPCGRVQESPPRGRLWLDLIHEAVRRMLAHDVPGGPVAPTVKIINLSVGDQGRPFLLESSPLARLLDWLSWKHDVLFVVSAGNHCDDLPCGCQDDGELLKYLFANRCHRRLLSPAESLNAITVGAVGLDPSTGPLPANAVPMPRRADLPAAYSALGRGYRRSVKPDVLMAGGRQLYQPRLPTADSPWTVLGRQSVGHLVATPASVGSRTTTRLAGTSNAAALTSRLGGLYARTLEDVISRGGQGAWLRELPLALLIKTLLVHTAEWQPEAFAFAKSTLGDWIDPSRAKDELAGLFGYGVLRGERGLGCAPERASAVGGGRIGPSTRIRHRVPIPASMHLFGGWRRLTVTLAWLSPINCGHRQYRIARLGLELPQAKTTPLGVRACQVHSDATTRGTVQHIVLERSRAVMNVADRDEFELFVNCAEDGGTLADPVAYGLAVTLEVERGTDLPIYEEVRARVEQRVLVPARVR